MEQSVLEKQTAPTHTQAQYVSLEFRHIFIVIFFIIMKRIFYWWLNQNCAFEYRCKWMEYIKFHSQCVHNVLDLKSPENVHENKKLSLCVYLDRQDM